MNSRKLEWKKVKIGADIRHEGQSEDYGIYIIERDEARNYHAWWGGIAIGVADNVLTSRAIAQSHCNRL